MPRKKAVNGYKMPEALSKGEILQDVSKKQWRLGPSIGKGGFGEIYSAQDADKAASTKYPYVIKIEPHGNGPLFVERNFYLRNAKPVDIEKFKDEHNLSSFGMPAFWGSGSHEFDKEKYRFVVMEKFGKDIDKLFEENNRSFSIGTVFKLALQMTYVLEYIHQTGYIHADLKGANILMGTNDNNNYQAYLVDFGLATKFTTDKQFKPNPKKAHDGTIEYLSRDAHKGVPTRRGDFEVLAYNIVHWLGGTLPWLKKLKDPNLVHASKEECMGNIEKFMKDAFGSKTPPDSLKKFLKYVNSMEFNEEPDYNKIRKIFIEAIEISGNKDDNKLSFTKDKKTPTKRKIVQKSESVDDKKLKMNEEVKEKKKVTRKVKTADVNNGEEILTAEMKKILERREQKLAEKKTKKSKKVDEKIVKEDLNGYNDEMKEVYAKKTEKKIKKTVLNEIPSTSKVDNKRNLRKLAKIDYADT